MTDEKVLSVVAGYTAKLNANAAHEGVAAVAVRHADIAFCDAADFQLREHSLWACQQIKLFIAEGRREKAMRWLGWLQCAMWVQGHIVTIEDGARDNAEPSIFSARNIGSGIAWLGTPSGVVETLLPEARVETSLTQEPRDDEEREAIHVGQHKSCLMQRGGWQCTRKRGHSGRHIAGGAGPYVCASWDAE